MYENYFYYFYQKQYSKEIIESKYKNLNEEASVINEINNVKIKNPEYESSGRDLNRKHSKDNSEQRNCLLEEKKS